MRFYYTHRSFRLILEAVVVATAVWRLNRPSELARMTQDRALDQILLFGDSITQFASNPALQGWGAILAHKYMRKLDVINRGFSGFNTEWCKHLLADTLRTVLPNATNSQTQPPKIRIMTLFLGANDGVDPEFNQRHHVSLPNYNQNMHEMLETVRTHSPGTKVIVITPPPVNPEAWAVVCRAKGKVPDRNAAHTKKYRDECIRIYEEAKPKWGRDLILVDIWEVFFGPGRTEYEMSELDELLIDGLHLGMKGNKLLGYALVKAISDIWPELDYEKMENAFF